MNVLRYTVGELAKRSGVSARMIRRFDAVGLLKPGERSGAGYRLYQEADVHRLDLIVALRAVGYGIREIRKILDGDSRHIRSAVERGAQAMAREIERLSESREILLWASAAGSDEEVLGRVRSAVGFARTAGEQQKTTALALLQSALVQAIPPEIEVGEGQTDAVVQLLHSRVPTPRSPEQESKLAEAMELLHDETSLQTFSEEVKKFADRFGPVIAKVEQTDWRARVTELQNRLRRAAKEGVAPDDAEAIALAQEWDRLFAQALGLTEAEYEKWKRESEERLQKTPLPDLLRLVSELTPHDPDKAAKRLLQSARRARTLAD